MSAARFFAVLAVIVVLQMELFSELRILGVMPELLLGLTVACAWSAGANRGALAGFVSGLVFDVFLSTPLALTALAYTLVGYAVGVIAESAALAPERGLRRLVSIAGIAAGTVIFALLGELLAGSELVGGHLVRVALIAPLLTAPFMPLLYRCGGWIWQSERDGAPPRRPQSVLK
ncbi:MAG: rod shape-determining protein MreD [Acidimicrobiales bacterium]